MKLSSMRGPLRAELASARYQPVFEEARQRERRFGRHRNILSVIAALDPTSDEPYSEREGLTRALVREQRRHAHGLWAAALLLAFVPMLSSLRGRIRHDELGGDDLDQLVVESFLEVPRRRRARVAPKRTALWLKKETARVVFARIGERKRELARLEALGEVARNDEDFELFIGRAPTHYLTDDDREEVAELLTERFTGLISRARLAIVVDTHR